MRNEFIVGVCHDLIKWHYHKNSDAVINHRNKTLYELRMRVTLMWARLAFTRSAC